MTRRYTRRENALPREIRFWVKKLPPQPSGKTKIGMGLKMKKKPTKRAMNKRIFPIRNAVLSYLSCHLGVLGSLVGGAADKVAKAVNDNKVVQRQLEELKHHNRAMESHGLYFAPYKCGRSASSRKKKRQREKIPKNVTTNVQLQHWQRVSYFRGVFMRTTLPRSTSK
ncbi:hypothetical protein P5V15_007034 [Pogonomyrmex californicus]